jgi:hypothetical protein
MIRAAKQYQKPGSIEVTMVKKNQKVKGNQVSKALGRFKKLTLDHAMLKRVTSWLKLETKGNEKTELSALRAYLVTMCAAHTAVHDSLQGLNTHNYQPPKKSTSGELKFEQGRKVWIKPKFMDIYLIAYPEEVLQRLFVDKVVKGRVVLSVDEPDKDGNMTPRIMAPKIHITGTAPVS